MDEIKLFEAASKDDALALQELLENDPFLLDRVSFTCNNKTPLHVATMKGNLCFVQEILNRNPDLAELLDSQQSSPLHEASAKGHVEIAKMLLAAAPDTCLTRDCQGKNPLHLAAVKGRIHVLLELVRRCPLAARERLDEGQTVLHLCVKHDRLESLKVLVSNLNEQLVNAKDNEGNTIMHMVVADRQIEAICYLVENNKVNVSVVNSKGLTPQDLLEKLPTGPEKSKIGRILQPALRRSHSYQAQPAKWLNKKRDSIMVVAILIATMAFQAGLTPPGGLWQDDLTQNTDGSNDFKSHNAGESVMSYRHPKFYRNFIRANTIAFVSSLSIILLLISGLPFKRRLFMWFLMVIMWLTVTSIAVTYGLSILIVTPKIYRKSLSHVTETAITVWCSVMGILLIGNTIRLSSKWLKSKGISIWPERKFKIMTKVQEQHSNGATQEAV